MAPRNRHARASTEISGPGGLTTRNIVFREGRSALAVFAPADVSGNDAVAALGLASPRALVVLNGSTEELPPELTTLLRRTLGDGLARVTRESRLTVVTGGTDAGIFALFGQALGRQRTAPCVGVAPVGVVTWPGRSEGDSGVATVDDRVPLEPHHSHFLLVEGDEWGTETEALTALTEALGTARPSIAVVAGGGVGTKLEVLAQTRLGREVLVLAGTGRFADELAVAVAGGFADPEIAEAAASGLLTVLDLEEPPAAFAEIVRQRLALPTKGPKR
jgi:hypothetical protein